MDPSPLTNSVVLLSTSKKKLKLSEKKAALQMAIVVWVAWDRTTELKFWRTPKLVRGFYQPSTPPVGLAGSMTLPPPPPSKLWFFASQ